MRKRTGLSLMLMGLAIGGIAGCRPLAPWTPRHEPAVDRAASPAAPAGPAAPRP